MLKWLYTILRDVKSSSRKNEHGTLNVEVSKEDQVDPHVTFFLQSHNSLNYRTFNRIFHCHWRSYALHFVTE